MIYCIRLSIEVQVYVKEKKSDYMIPEVSFA